MLLLFKPAVILPAASLGIVLGLSGAGSGVSATLTTNVGLTAPTSIELLINAVPDIHLGLSGISVGFLTRTASVGTQLGIQAAGGFGGSGAPAITMGLSGTVGSFFDGGAVTLDTVLGLSGVTTPNATASIPLALGLTGAPTVSGGTVTPAATAGIALGLSATPLFVDHATVDIAMTLNGVAVVASAVIPSETIAHISFAPFPDHISFTA